MGVRRTIHEGWFPILRGDRPSAQTIETAQPRKEMLIFKVFIRLPRWLRPPVHRWFTGLSLNMIQLRMSTTLAPPSRPFGINLGALRFRERLPPADLMG